MRGASVLSILVLLGLPFAQAGTEADPEVDDLPDQDTKSLDLLAAWLENTWSGVRFTVKVAELKGIPAEKAYYVGFDVDGARHVGYIEFDKEGKAHTIFAKPGFAKQFPNRESYPDTLRDVDVEIGAPGYVTAIIPWGAVTGLEPGAAVADIYAGTDNPLASGDFTDIRFTERTFVLERAFPWVGALATAGGVLVVAALATALVVARRRRASPPAPPPARAMPPSEAEPALAHEDSRTTPRFDLGPRR